MDISIEKGEKELSINEMLKEELNRERERGVGGKYLSVMMLIVELC